MPRGNGRWRRGITDLLNLNPGAHVVVQDPVTKKWTKHGRIVERMKNNDFLIKLVSGSVLRRNRRFVRVRSPNLVPEDGNSATAHPVVEETPAVTCSGPGGT